MLGSSCAASDPSGDMPGYLSVADECIGSPNGIVTCVSPCLSIVPCNVHKKSLLADLDLQSQPHSWHIGHASALIHRSQSKGRTNLCYAFEGYYLGIGSDAPVSVCISENPTFQQWMETELPSTLPRADRPWWEDAPFQVGPQPSTPDALTISSISRDPDELPNNPKNSRNCYCQISQDFGSQICGFFLASSRL